MTIQIISHTDHSRTIEKQGMGEIVNAQKLKTLLLTNQFTVNEIWDIYELFGGSIEGLVNISKITLINGKLAIEGQNLYDNFNMDVIDEIWERFELLKDQIQALLVLTWDYNLAALLGTGIQRAVPTISKCYAFSPEEALFPKLFAPTHLIVTESLLGNEKLIKSKVDPSQVIYLPHHYPVQALEIAKTNDRKAILDGLSKRVEKVIPIGCFVIGAFGRFQFRKNIEYLIDAVEKLYQKYPHIILWIKGDFDPSADKGEGVGYTERLQQLFAEKMNLPWFFWDSRYTGFPEVLNEYASCDLLVHLSGAESASNAVVEYISLKKPCLALNASSNPYLFGDAVEWVEAEKHFVKGKLPFKVPKLHRLNEKIEELIISDSKREKLAERARLKAMERFSPELTLERMPLIIEAAQAAFQFKLTPSLKNKIVNLYKKDLKTYGLTHLL